MLDLNLLRTVATIAATRSLTKAAEELHCSQSTLRIRLPNGNANTE